MFILISFSLKVVLAFVVLFFISLKLGELSGTKRNMWNRKLSLKQKYHRLIYSHAVAQTLYRANYGLDDRGSNPGKGNDENFSLRHCVYTCPAAHGASYPVSTGGSYLGYKAAGA